MTKLLVTLFVFSSCSFFGFAISSAQETKIGLVDRYSVFERYYRTKEFTKTMLSKRDAQNESSKNTANGLHQLAGEIQNLSQQIASAPDVNGSKTAEQEKLIQKYNEQVKRHLESNKAAMNALMNERGNMERAILADIDAIVKEVAEAKGVEIIVNRSNRGRSVVVYYNSDRVVDITEEVIEKLNQAQR